MNPVQFEINKQLINYNSNWLIEINGVEALVYKTNENGELINPISSKSCDYLNNQFTINESNSNNIENFVYQTLANYFSLDISEICILNNNLLSVCIRENADGYQDEKNGEYFVDYIFEVLINGKPIDANDMYTFFQNFSK